MEFHSESPISIDAPSSVQALVHHKPLRCIVKLGGAAITCKNELERINEENLKSVCSQLREAMYLRTSDTPDEVFGMEWSRRPGVSIDSMVNEFDEQSCLGSPSSFILVHGAGSFGHFQASRSGVHKGGLHLPLVKAGFVATRISIYRLHVKVLFHQNCNLEKNVEGIVNLCHQRVGHIHGRALKVMSQKQMVKGLPNIKFEHTLCESCIRSKADVPQKASWRSKELLELIHGDLWDPAQVESLGGNIAEP